MKKYINTEFEKGKAFFIKNRGKGKIKMLNLLKFKDIADYSDFPSIAPDQSLSGNEAYKKYMDSIAPLLEEAGSKILLQGNCDPFLIGPTNENWDMALIVEHSSAEAFVSFAQNPKYQELEGHRIAALSDSRLLPFI